MNKESLKARNQIVYPCNEEVTWDAMFYNLVWEKNLEEKLFVLF